MMGEREETDKSDGTSPGRNKDYYEKKKERQMTMKKKKKKKTAKERKETRGMVIIQNFTQIHKL